MHYFLAELIGTAILVIFGDGVVANVVLNKTKGQGGGWIVITFGWAMGVFVAVFCVAAYSGAHINPAVTVAMLAAGKISVATAGGYIAAQMLGGILGGMLVFFHYRDHFAASDNADLKLAVFCTGPAIRNIPNNFFCEVLGTFMLVFPIFCMGTTGNTPTVGLGSLGALPVGLLVLAIGLSLGGTTGYAINPARDLGPRIAHAILPIPGKRDSDWGYAWVPVIGPLLGGLAATAAAVALHI
ncbi:MAG: aquaporin family protein [Phycisphaeraceae bacterium]|nr:aquaporin family protein [Phycisphaeraceae bacterium]